MALIKDGSGKGFVARVNSDLQLVTRATAVEQRLVSALDENYYEATTGQITLANATETGIIYLKNSDTEKVLVIDRVFYDLWASTAGADDAVLRYYKTVTITGGTDITPNNTNFSSANSAIGTFKKSLTSFSGTEWWTAYIVESSSNALEEGRIILNKNDTFAITVAAGTGNTDMKVSVNVAFYYFDATLV